jgi:SAM-dependent methyltransferase
MNDTQTELKKSYNIIWKEFTDRDEYETLIEDRKTTRKVYYDLISEISKNFIYPKVLELGCGTGIDINNVYESNKNIGPFASDILPRSVEVGRKISQSFENNINFFVGDTLILPIKDQQFDVVFSQGLVEHFRNPLTVIKEQVRILKNGGCLIINVPQKYTGYTLMKRKKIKDNQWDLGWETEFSYNDLIRFGNQIELSEVSVCGYQYWKSWKEPTFVIKDLIDKFFRQIPLEKVKFLANFQKAYNSLIKKIEVKWGHYFLQNIVIIFKK